MTSHLVVQEVQTHAGLRPLDQVMLDLATDLIVMDDEELEEDGVLGGIDALEDAGEGGVAVDQELEGVAAQSGNPGQSLGAQAAGLILSGGNSNSRTATSASWVTLAISAISPRRA